MSLSKKTLLISTCLLVVAAQPWARADAIPIRVCGHIPITGAAPIPHNPARFGRFYFDYVNAELGGVNGRPVQFDAIDDQFDPPDARQAMAQCQQEGADLYFGYMGTDQIVSVAKWAEQQHVPYLHAGGSAKDLDGFQWSAFLSPTDEDSETALADVVLKNTGALTDGAAPAVGMLRLNSPYYDAAHDAFVGELSRAGVSLKDDEVVQKDSSEFSAVLTNMFNKGVNIINLDVTPTIVIKLLNQMQNFPTYHPAFISAVSEIASNIDAQAAAGANVKHFEVLTDPSPSCHCTYFNTDLDESSPWAAEMHEFLRIFRQYSPEENPPPDDFDWMSYLRAKQIHRFLVSLNGDYSAGHIRDAFSSSAETAGEAFPTCPLDFGSTPHEGQHAWNLYSLDGQTWKQIDTCTTPARIPDTSPPIISCPAQPVVTGALTCSVADLGSGVGAWKARSNGIPAGVDASGDGGCREQASIAVSLPPGVHRLSLSVPDCSGNVATENILVVSA